MGEGKVLVDNNVLVQLLETNNTRVHEMGLTGRIYTIQAIVQEFKAKRSDAVWNRMQARFNITVLPDPKPGNPVFRSAVRDFNMGSNRTRADALLAAASKIYRIPIVTADEPFATKAQQFGAIVKLSSITKAKEDPVDPSKLVRVKPLPQLIRQPRIRNEQKPNSPYRPTRPDSGRPNRPKSGTPPSTPPSTPNNSSTSVPRTPFRTRVSNIGKGLAGSMGSFAAALKEKQEDNIWNDAYNKGKEVIEKSREYGRLKREGRFVVSEIVIAEGPYSIIDHPFFVKVRFRSALPYFDEDKNVDWEKTEANAIEEAHWDAEILERGYSEREGWPSGVDILDLNLVSYTYDKYYPDVTPISNFGEFRDKTGRRVFDRCTNSRW